MRGMGEWGVLALVFFFLISSFFRAFSLIPYYYIPFLLWFPRALEVFAVIRSYPRGFLNPFFFLKILALGEKHRV